MGATCNSVTIKGVADRVEAIMSELAVAPEQLDVESNLVGGHIEFKVVCNTADSRRFVGANGSTIAALKQVALLIADNLPSRVAVNFHRIEANQQPEVPRMAPSSGFNLEEALALTGRWVQWMFPTSRIEVNAAQNGECSITATVNGDEKPHRVTQAASALRTIMIPVSRKKWGKVIYANVTRRDCGDAEADNAARGAVRRSGAVHGHVETKSVETVPRRPGR